MKSLTSSLVSVPQISTDCGSLVRAPIFLPGLLLTHHPKAKSLFVAQRYSHAWNGTTHGEFCF